MILLSFFTFFTFENRVLRPCIWDSIYSLQIFCWNPYINKFLQAFDLSHHSMTSSLPFFTFFTICTFRTMFLHFVLWRFHVRLSTWESKESFIFLTLSINLNKLLLYEKWKKISLSVFSQIHKKSLVKNFHIIWNFQMLLVIWNDYHIQACCELVREYNCYLFCRLHDKTAATRFCFVSDNDLWIFYYFLSFG